VGVEEVKDAGIGSPVLEGVRNLEGVVGAEGNREKFGDGKLFLVFVGEGIGGSAPVGGSKGGCKDFGSVMAINCSNYRGQLPARKRL
jgi:hypothetical protein